MRIYTKLVLDIETMQVLSSESFEYDGAIAEAKGEGTSKAQLELNNQLVQQQLTRQNAIQDQMKAAFSKYLEGDGQGFSPEQMATLNQQFLDSQATDFSSAGQNVRAALASRGAGVGDVPAGGDYVRGIAELEGAKANSQASGLGNIRLANLQQALMNRFNAGSIMQGQSAQLGQNIGAFSSGANNSLNQYMQAANSGFGASFMRSLGSALGGGLGGLATTGIAGGLGSAMSSGTGAISVPTGGSMGMYGGPAISPFTTVPGYTPSLPPLSGGH